MIKITNKHVIAVSDWDDLVEKTYGKSYSFQQQDGCKERQTVDITVPVEDPEDFENTEIPFKINGEEMGVSFNTWINTDLKSTSSNFEHSEWRVKLFWERNFYPHIDMIINDLHSKGILKAGDYSIEIDW